MFPRITEARHVSDYIVWLRFEDGVEGEVDLREELWGPIFEPLLDPTYFRRFSIHPELQTIVWENGADFSPEFLYKQVRATA
ncbi:MAG: hypothetical protein A2X67_13070 [Ignavibacteria bacterium GWA2_55_11]|nr:MAG: hypothetical protein A2X67_13070 [Ignavibacteria bacterium GWA2_55_11]OGU47390.1 MAG: hypothetical protein A2X68_12325 [Ignavibacteria bacterium GWC2_56_12]OGU68059.1 MAG: hypothetical protein A3C56_08040 [Ignavibacteria bacterium RIFCSPHIGHO2_02_FULL_56_12]OGU69318.1 MAG: hypothetical protein A3H45_14620 [Ignavibacteria bacterium RIFCSPLOWO2_02_FULL_55_14]OGU76890.1 MAG: hypothetical protein A3G43_08730 [Ignavibacteria bacterium RIFCSPLOWO2_12_FULL_56_21]HAV21970.1 DUF2442 domain-cont